jgi:hypothetical protein
MSESESVKNKTDTPTTPPRKKKKYYCSFSDNWLKEDEFKEWLLKRNAKEGECRLCRQTFSVAFEGRRAVLAHAASSKHKSVENLQKHTAVMSSFFKKPNTKEDDLITAAEVTLTYHSVKHHHSYSSEDCGNKLSGTIFTDSAIAKKMSCGRTKSSSIVENVLAIAAQEILLSELKSAKYFSIGTDSSNKGNMKMFPLTVQYFSVDDGIKRGLLDFYEDPQESSEAVKDQIIRVLKNNDLEINNVSALSADNAAVNYGKNVSVYQKLKSEHPGIVKANCKCHILHNCSKFALKGLSFDVEILILKVYAEFSSFAKRTAELKSFFEFVDLQYRDLLRHVTTRWLSLLPALDRLLLNWPALRAYFVSQGEEECTKMIWESFRDEEDDCLPLCYCYFVQNVMQLFQNSVQVLESDYITSTELHDIMCGLRKNITDRKNDKFYGKSAMDTLKKLDNNKKIKFEVESDKFFSRCLTYLDKWYDFNNSSFKDMSVLSLQRPVTWSEVEDLATKCALDLDTDKLYDDFSLLREAQDILAASNCRIDSRWVEFFRKLKDKNCGTEMKKLVAFVLSIPVSNATCERTFSVMNQLWSKERNRLRKELVKAELQVCENFQLSCAQFHAFLMKSPRILAAARSETKYNFKK